LAFILPSYFFLSKSFSKILPFFGLDFLNIYSDFFLIYINISVSFIIINPFPINFLLNFFFNPFLKDSFTLFLDIFYSLFSKINILLPLSSDFFYTSFPKYFIFTKIFVFISPFLLIHIYYILHIFLISCIFFLIPALNLPVYDMQSPISPNL